MPEATGSRSLGLAVGLDCAATVGLESDRGIGKANGGEGRRMGAWSCWKAEGC